MINSAGTSEHKIEVEVDLNKSQKRVSILTSQSYIYRICLQTLNLHYHNSPEKLLHLSDISREIVTFAQSSLRLNNIICSVLVFMNCAKNHCNPLANFASYTGHILADLTEIAFLDYVTQMVNKKDFLTSQLRFSFASV